MVIKENDRVSFFESDSKEVTIFIALATCFEETQVALEDGGFGDTKSEFA